jgi:hypothetical protein
MPVGNPYKNFGVKIDLSLFAGRGAAFFLAFFGFLAGFFATLGFLVFLAILDPPACVATL